MDIKKILETHGIEESLIEAISSDIKKEIPKEFVSKTQYNKKITEIGELNEKISTLESNVGADEYKEKFESLKQEFDSYKTQLETEKINTTKQQALKEALMSSGVKNDKLANLLLKEFDIETIELEEGNKLKNGEDLIKGVRETYADFFTVQKVVGNTPPTPPSNGSQKAYSLEDLKTMTPEQIKANYSQIQESLKQQ